MTKVQVRDVSAETHAVLKRRAAAAGQSLQEYLRALLDEHAATPTVAEVMERVGHRSGSVVTADDVVASVRADRASH
ncbi:MAG: hypothetical protein KY460_16140 [Actinobacteria bacterium]|nr:hypothetical protein [Actinomycetota bacterium]